MDILDLYFNTCKLVKMSIQIYKSIFKIIQILLLKHTPFKTARKKNQEKVKIPSCMDKKSLFFWHPPLHAMGNFESHSCTLEFFKKKLEIEFFTI